MKVKIAKKVILLFSIIFLLLTIHLFYFSIQVYSSPIKFSFDPGPNEPPSQPINPFPGTNQQISTSQQHLEQTSSTIQAVKQTYIFTMEQTIRSQGLITTYRQIGQPPQLHGTPYNLEKVIVGIPSPMILNIKRHQKYGSLPQKKQIDHHQILNR